jgi:P-type Na+/K+ transporter
MIAMIVSMIFRDWIEGIVLAFVIVLNISVGTLQEWKAEKKMDALRALSSPSAKVLRDGEIQVIPK